MSSNEGAVQAGGVGGVSVSPAALSTTACCRRHSLHGHKAGQAGKGHAGLDPL